MMNDPYKPIQVQELPPYQQQQAQYGFNGQQPQQGIPVQYPQGQMVQGYPQQGQQPMYQVNSGGYPQQFQQQQIIYQQVAIVPINPLMTQLMIAESRYQSKRRCFSICNAIYGIISIILLVRASLEINFLNQYEVSSDEGSQNQSNFNSLIVAEQLYIVEYSFWLTASVLGCLGFFSERYLIAIFWAYNIFLDLTVIFLIAAFATVMKALSNYQYIAEPSDYFFGIGYGLFILMLLIVWSFFIKNDYYAVLQAKMNLANENQQNNQQGQQPQQQNYQN